MLGPHLTPSCCDINHIYGADILSCCALSAMVDEVYLEVPGFLLPGETTCWNILDQFPLPTSSPVAPDRLLPRYGGQKPSQARYAYLSPHAWPISQLWISIERLEDQRYHPFDLPIIYLSSFSSPLLSI